MKPTGNKVRSIAIQILVISLISFTMGEVALRVYNHFNPSYLFNIESRNKQFRGKPFASDGEFKLNSLGFKDKEFLPKAQTGYRIVALGDSFAFGVVQYDQNYLMRIPLKSPLLPKQTGTHTRGNKPGSCLSIELFILAAEDRCHGQQY